MWAFALYDKTKNNILLSRDRFGEKPCVLRKQGMVFILDQN